MIRRFSAVTVATLLIAVLPRLALGAHSPINAKALLHNSWSLKYRSPFGAVPAGTPVRLTLRTAAGGADSVTLQVTREDANGNRQGRSQQGLHVASHAKRYELWQTTFTPQAIGIYRYDFQIRFHGASLWYASNILQDGGRGQAYAHKPSTLFSITAYDPSFHTPPGMQNAVIYQIFPDRFYNGDPSNDTRGMDPIDGTIHPYIHKSWDELPLPGGYDFFGGDLQGIIDKLPYLKNLGINTLYLNPIFEAPSNHKYDTADYFTIDPRFGNLATFQHLVDAARADGIAIILDGVFNHTGSDSIYFNKYGTFDDVGAYQSKSSPYYSWYTFTSWPTLYQEFPGADTLPQLAETNAVKDFIFRSPDSVAQYWLGQGTLGWRLDASGLKSTQWWQEFRQSVKARFPDAVLIAEPSDWNGNYLPTLMGDQFDGVMNYHFRTAVLGYFGHGVDGSVPLQPKGFFATMMGMLESTPLPAIQSSMNLVDSHDTIRIQQELGGNIQQQEEVAAFQMTWPGAPTIYYGDEAGLTGGADPDDRRTFPWDSQNTSLEQFYKTVIGLRNAHPALRDGSVKPLVINSAHRIVSYERVDSTDRIAVVLNDATKDQTVTLKGLKSGQWTDALSGKSFTVNGPTRVAVGKFGAAILVPATATNRR